MFEINKKHQEEIATLNKNILEKYGDILKLDKRELKDLISEKAGTFYSLYKLSDVELGDYKDVVAVDGSVNKVGGNYPHYVEMYQGMAKSTKGREIILNDIYTPLLDSDEHEKREDAENRAKQARSKKLAEIEIYTAMEYAKAHTDSIIIMDGGLIRYNIDARQAWDELKEICLDHNITLIGVIKDIKTNILGASLFDREDIYDREMLLGNLEYGDLLLIHDEATKKYAEGEGFSTAFLRSSKQRVVVGIDIIADQKENLTDVANLLFSLTPENSRGVPLWIDIVDREVRITDAYMEALLQEYLDRDIYERFFVSERSLRSL